MWNSLVCTTTQSVGEMQFKCCDSLDPVLQVVQHDVVSNVLDLALSPFCPVFVFCLSRCPSFYVCVSVAVCFCVCHSVCLSLSLFSLGCACAASLQPCFSPRLSLSHTIHHLCCVFSLPCWVLVSFRLCFPFNLFVFLYVWMCLSVYLCVWLSVCPSVCLSVNPLLWLSICSDASPSSLQPAFSNCLYRSNCPLPWLLCALDLVLFFCVPLSVSLGLCLSLCLSVCVIVPRSVCLSVSLSAAC